MQIPQSKSRCPDKGTVLKPYIRLATPQSRQVTCIIDMVPGQALSGQSLQHLAGAEGSFNRQLAPEFGNRH